MYELEGDCTIESEVSRHSIVQQPLDTLANTNTDAHTTAHTTQVVNVGTPVHMETDAHSTKNTSAKVLQKVGHVDCIIVGGGYQAAEGGGAMGGGKVFDFKVNGKCVVGLEPLSLCRQNAVEEGGAEEGEGVSKDSPVGKTAVGEAETGVGKEGEEEDISKMAQAEGGREGGTLEENVEMNDVVSGDEVEVLGVQKEGEIWHGGKLRVKEGELLGTQNRPAGGVDQGGGKKDGACEGGEGGKGDVEGGGGSDEEIEIVGTEGQFSLVDYAHSRDTCVSFKFGAVEACKNCWCFVCEVQWESCGSWALHHKVVA